MATKRKSRPSTGRTAAMERDLALAQAILALSQAQLAMASKLPAPGGRVGVMPAAPAPSEPVPFAHEGVLQFNDDRSPFVETVNEGEVQFSTFENLGDKQFQLTFTINATEMSPESRSQKEAKFLADLQNYLITRCQLLVVPCIAQCSNIPPPPPPPLNPKSPAKGRG